MGVLTKSLFRRLRLIAVFCAFAQEPVVGICSRLADLTKRLH